MKSNRLDETELELSDVLQRLKSGLVEPEVSVNHIIHSLADRGPLAMICLLCLPFVFPMPLPGVSTLFAIFIVLLAAGFWHPRLVYLPDRLLQKRISAQAFCQIIDKSTPALRRIEKLSKPRLKFLLSKTPIFLAMVLSAAFLALPVPPVIPFTNSLPGIAIFFTAYGSLQRDGSIVLLGHGMLIATIGYFYTIYSMIELMFLEIMARYF